MVQAFVHKIPAARIEGGMLVLDFPSGDELVSVAMTRHAAIGLFSKLPHAFEAFEKNGELSGRVEADEV